MTGIRAESSGALRHTELAVRLASGLLPVAPVDDPSRHPQEEEGVILHAGDGKQYRVLDVGKWSFDRINRELHELACSGWKLIAVAGYGQCGVRLWLVK